MSVKKNEKRIALISTMMLEMKKKNLMIRMNNVILQRDKP